MCGYANILIYALNCPHLVHVDTLGDMTYDYLILEFGNGTNEIVNIQAGI